MPSSQEVRNIKKYANKLFNNNKSNVTRWYTKPNYYFEGLSPKEYVKSGRGKEVLDFLKSVWEARR